MVLAIQPAIKNISMYILGSAATPTSQDWGVVLTAVYAPIRYVRVHRARTVAGFAIMAMGAHALTQERTGDV